MHSTGRSAAMFMESYGPPGVRALTRASRAFMSIHHQAFAIRRCPDAAHCTAMHGQEELLADTARELTTHGGAIEQLDAAATLARLCPA